VWKVKSVIVEDKGRFGI